MSMPSSGLVSVRPTCICDGFVWVRPSTRESAPESGRGRNYCGLQVLLLRTPPNSGLLGGRLLLQIAVTQIDETEGTGEGEGPAGPLQLAAAIAAMISCGREARFTQVLYQVPTSPRAATASGGLGVLPCIGAAAPRVAAAE
jgi:hypothetical protein